MKNKLLDLLACFVACLAFWGFMFLCAYPNLEKPQNEKGEKIEASDCAVELFEKKTEEEPQKNTKNLGEFVLTAYCGEKYPHICNDGDATKTATGIKPTANRTIAVDPSVIPYGTKVYINGQEYIAEDCGGGIRGNRIDIFFDSHKDALDFGVQKAVVEVCLRGE